MKMEATARKTCQRNSSKWSKKESSSSIGSGELFAKTSVVLAASMRHLALRYLLQLRSSFLSIKYQVASIKKSDTSILVFRIAKIRQLQ